MIPVHQNLDFCFNCGFGNELVSFFTLCVITVLMSGYFVSQEENWTVERIFTCNYIFFHCNHIFPSNSSCQQALHYTLFLVSQIPETKDSWT